MKRNYTIDIAENMFKTSVLSDDKVIFKTEVKFTLKIIKEFYHYNILKSIKVGKKENGLTELEYELYDAEDCEIFKGCFWVKDNVDSIKDLYDNAKLLENRVSEISYIEFLD